MLFFGIAINCRINVLNPLKQVFKSNKPELQIQKAAESPVNTDCLLLPTYYNQNTLEKAPEQYFSIRHPPEGWLGAAVSTSLWV